MSLSLGRRTKVTMGEYEQRRVLSGAAEAQISVIDKTLLAPKLR